MVKLAFIKQTATANAADPQGVTKEDEATTLVLKMWQELEGEKNNGITSDNLRVFTGAIMKILLSPEIDVNTKNRYGGFTEDGGYIVSQTQATKIHKDFNLLYLNRTAFANAPVNKTQEDAECSFKPVICEKSVVLAGNYREKIVGKSHLLFIYFRWNFCTRRRFKISSQLQSN